MAGNEAVAAALAELQQKIREPVLEVLEGKGPRPWEELVGPAPGDEDRADG